MFLSGEFCDHVDVMILHFSEAWRRKTEVRDIAFLEIFPNLGSRSRSMSCEMDLSTRRIWRMAREAPPIHCNGLHARCTMSYLREGRHKTCGEELQLPSVCQLSLM